MATSGLAATSGCGSQCIYLEAGFLVITIRAAGWCCINRFFRRDHHGRSFCPFLLRRFSALGLKLCSVWLLSAICFSTVSRAAGPDCSRPYTLALHDHGLLYSADTDSGIDRDFADELSRRSGCNVIISLMSRARIWQLIESGALDFSLSGIATPERLRYASFAWYFSNKYYLLVRKDSGIRQVSQVEDIPRFQLGVIRSFRYSDAANRLVDVLSSRDQVVLAGGLDPLYAALLSNRIQGMIMEPFDYPALQAKNIREQTTIVEFNDPATSHGLIMSNKSLSPGEREKWRALVDAMRADGTVKRIFEKYFSAALAGTMVDFQVAP
ncbi:polar amino acid transport system substrate-binding protein [Herbaspirillum sp. Sphag1AN]|uniref:substrate-binding periplasmic protein n=1 Tax=unclassified Herbaspirillum TaxID=2624150 RepID=UPI00160F231F|nr:MULTISPECIES: transporter substrate-binding domain-containing protein [unclassified Herbaspirillum]MBB3214057.1 polar amino acid transport system substrate-binding protein [Herbaspirillum sp. Sphag1AN]MBB3247550.1 polar amino acid transport system substrate-binding protein [Herbaspirillum sp. Sphag64]